MTLSSGPISIWIPVQFSNGNGFGHPNNEQYLESDKGKKIPVNYPGLGSRF